MFHKILRFYSGDCRPQTPTSRKLLICIFIWLGAFVGIVSAEPPVATTVIVTVAANAKLQDTEHHKHPWETQYPHIASWRPAVYKGHDTQLTHTTDQHILVIPDGEAPENFAATLASIEGVLKAEPNYPVRAFQSDPMRYLQTHLDTDTLRTLPTLPGKKEVLVAVLDSGIDYYHPDLKGRIYANPRENLNGKDTDGNGFIDDIYGYDFYGFYKGEGHPNPNDGFGHGTHIAGIIAAETDNGIGISGLGAQVKLLNVRFLDDRGYGNQYDAAAAIHYAVDMGAKIINCSWGYFKATTFLEDALQYAASRGVIVVGAAGNTGQDDNEYPASYPSVISVGAVTLAHTKAYFSNVGKVDTALYGEAVYSTLPNNQYGQMSGTSQSAAMASGVLARLVSYLPDATPDTIRQLYFDACVVPAQEKHLGKGVFSTSKLFELLHHTPTLPDQQGPTSDTTLMSTPLTVSHVMAYPNPYRNHTAYIGYEISHTADIRIMIFTLDGVLLRTVYSNASSGYNRIAWDLRTDRGDVFKNGSYLYVLEAKTSQGTQTSRGKFAVLL